MTTPTTTGTRRLRATIIGLGFDGRGGPKRIITGEQCLLVGGSYETHADMLETVLRLEDELDRIGQHLGDVAPAQLAEIAWRIDSPELHEIALHLDAGLRRRGLSFETSTAEELTELASGAAI
jgi:hypothetical protein